MIFKIKHEKKGGHIHCRLFAAKAPNMAKAGWHWVEETFERGQIRFVCLKDGDNYILASRFNSHGGAWIAVDAEDARLIVAAPAMKTELAEIAEDLRSFIEAGTVPDATWVNDTHDSIRGVIKKATTSEAAG